MKIALDFDNVLANTMMEWIACYNRKYHMKITKENITVYDFWRNNLPITKQNAMKIFYYVWSHWEWLPPSETYLTQKIENIQKLGMMDIVTSVPESHMQCVKKWIEKHGIPHEHIIHCESSDKVVLPYDIYIDDSPNIARDCMNGRKQCLIYDQPWNRNIKGNNTDRIHTLTEACDVIAKRLR